MDSSADTIIPLAQVFGKADHLMPAKSARLQRDLKNKRLVYLLKHNSCSISGKYKVGDDALPHFVTFSVVGWIDVFSREEYKEIFVKSLKYCQKNKGLVLHAGPR